jgi:hypothetical protein
MTFFVNFARNVCFQIFRVKIDLLCQITILPTEMSDFHRQSEFETIVNAV